MEVVDAVRRKNFKGFGQFPTQMRGADPLAFHQGREGGVQVQAGGDDHFDRVQGGEVPETVGGLFLRLLPIADVGDEPLQCQKFPVVGDALSPRRPERLSRQPLGRQGK